MHIGLLEDSEPQLEVLSLRLKAAGHTTKEFATIVEMRTGLTKETFDLLIIDWMLPDGNGQEIISFTRSQLGLRTPIIVLTARDEEHLVVQALQAGADDYLVKPAKKNELMARIQALARRSQASVLPVLHLGEYEIDFQSHTLRMAGEVVSLTQKEFDLANYFFENPGKLMSRDHLLNKIWGLNVEVDTRTVDTHVSRLRRKLNLSGQLGWKMSPIYGYGYRLDRVEDVEA